MLVVACASWLCWSVTIWSGHVDASALGNLELVTIIVATRRCNIINNPSGVCNTFAGLDSHDDAGISSCTFGLHENLLPLQIRCFRDS